MLNWDQSTEHQMILDRFEQHIGPHLWFVTITLKPKLYKFQALTQYEMTVNDFHKLLEQRVQNAVHVTELTETGNVHYHAIIKTTDKIKLLSFVDAIKRSRSFGYIKLTSNPIHFKENLIRSAHYLVKELNVTAKVIGRPGYTPEILRYI